MLTSARIKENMDRDGIWMLSLSILWILLSCGLALLWHGILVYRVASRHYPVPKHSIWLLFGLQLQQNRMALEYQQRIDVVIATLRITQPDLIVFQGGLTGNNTVTEANIGEEYFNRVLARDHEAILARPQTVLEDRSKNSLENLRNTREYLLSKKLPLNVVLVTSGYHLRRCRLMAENLGFKTEFLLQKSVPSFSIKSFNKIILEAFLINWYQTGKFISLLFRNQRMLNRIR
jgi:uncharacterized SAM-binding protein YcdF (DUF218 family)